MLVLQLNVFLRNSTRNWVEYYTSIFRLRTIISRWKLLSILYAIQLWDPPVDQIVELTVGLRKPSFHSWFCRTSNTLQTSNICFKKHNIPPDVSCICIIKDELYEPYHSYGHSTIGAFCFGRAWKFQLTCTHFRILDFQPLPRTSLLELPNNWTVHVSYWVGRFVGVVVAGSDVRWVAPGSPRCVGCQNTWLERPHYL